MRGKIHIEPHAIRRYRERVCCDPYRNHRTDEEIIDIILFSIEKVKSKIKENGHEIKCSARFYLWEFPEPTKEYEIVLKKKSKRKYYLKTIIGQDDTMN